MKNNIFDEIVKGKLLDVNIIYKDKYVTAFDDIKPKAPVHIIVVPNIYIKNLNNVNIKYSFILSKMLLTAIKIANLKKINKSGYRIVINCNKDSGQEINYLHLHILGGCYLGNLVNINK